MPARSNYPAPLIASKFTYQGPTANSIVTNTRGWQNVLDTDIISSTPKQALAIIGDRIQGSSAERTLEILTRENPQTRRPGRWIRNRGYYSGGNFFDAHNTIAICWLNDGRLVTQWDTHDSPLNITTSATAGSGAISGKISIPFASGATTYENTCTYNQFVKYENGDRLHVYRYGVSGNGQTVLEFYDNSSGLWSLRQSNLISGESIRSAYTGAPPVVKKISGIEYTYIAWNWREVDSNYTTNHDLYCMVSADKGLTWNKLDGTSQTIPATASNGPLAYSLANNSGLWNANSICVDDSGRPYTFWYYGAAPSQSYCHYWKGTFLGTGSWQRSQVGTETGSNSLVGVTSPGSPLWTGPGAAVHRSGTIDYLVWSDNFESGLWAQTISTSSLQTSPSSTWTAHRVHTGDWSSMQHWINFDRSLWDTYGILDIYYQVANVADVARIDLTVSL